VSLAQRKNTHTYRYLMCRAKHIQSYIYLKAATARAALSCRPVSWIVNLAAQQQHLAERSVLESEVLSDDVARLIVPHPAGLLVWAGRWQSSSGEWHNIVCRYTSPTANMKLHLQASHDVAGLDVYTLLALYITSMQCPPQACWCGQLR